VPTEWDLVARVALAFGLSFVIGFERQLRGGPAGDRTYGLVGTAAGVVAAVGVTKASPQAIAGVVTGVGFIGGALVFRQGPEQMLRGLTSAAAVFATAAIGIAAGAGYAWLAIVTTVVALLVLELRYLPALRYLDARRYVGRFTGDDDPPVARRQRGSPPVPGPS
jgi:putative Mg2+ transporter-C (MgtC) family protein